MNLNDLNIDRSWTLFLDRDGVINRRILNGYVMTPDDFEFLPGVLEALKKLRDLFGRIIVVSNQQGVGRGVMTTAALDAIHAKMMEEVVKHGGRIDKVYHSPYREEEQSIYRKPAVGMGLKARKEYPGIVFKRSLMAGDSVMDMLFGRRLGMVTVLIAPDDRVARKYPLLVDFCIPDLLALAQAVSGK